MQFEIGKTDDFGSFKGSWGVRGRGGEAGGTIFIRVEHFFDVWPNNL